MSNQMSQYKEKFQKDKTELDFKLQKIYNLVEKMILDNKASIDGIEQLGDNHTEDKD